MVGMLIGVLGFVGSLVIVKSYEPQFLSIPKPIVHHVDTDEISRHLWKKFAANRLKAELNCLADNVYREAEFESEEGQKAVATVTLNRVHDPVYPGTICGVVYERHYVHHKIVCQFSWTCKPRHKVNRRLYQKARAVARVVLLKHQTLADLNGVTLYHASYVHPDWADRTEKVEEIGNHVFYRE